MGGAFGFIGDFLIAATSQYQAMSRRRSRLSCMRFNSCQIVSTWLRDRLLIAK
ncbi:hypothetical protein Pla52n_11850 [Stieleria varia]|uniref:Uncharacterized protein n=1 Tax=Stieleria varia TaxID=2528005 RepID=A0A5C6AZT3_9BACT|nr:hypothetical protein Pla52n_11850 [Stieleria varia]